jgi:hypothetical protein
MISIVEELHLGADCFKAAAGAPKRDGRAWLMTAIPPRGMAADAISCSVPDSVLRAGDELLSVQLRTDTIENAPALWLDVIDAGAQIARTSALRELALDRTIQGTVVLRVSPSQSYGHRAIGVLIRRARPQ